MSTPIDYQSRPVSQPPSEYEHAYDQERGRWLRRRLIWYSGTSLAFGLLLSLLTMAASGDQLVAADIVTLFVSNAAAALVMVLAWRCKPRASSVLRIAFLFYVLASLWTIGYTYSSFARQDNEFQRGFEVGREFSRKQATQRAGTTSPSTKPRLIEGDLSANDQPVTVRIPGGTVRTSSSGLRQQLLYTFAYLYLAFVLGLNHIIICLFIPWTIRESLRPALIIAGAAIGMAGIHVAFGLAAWWLLLLLLAVLPLAFTPGTLICWWRYSQFNQRFLMQFESNRYRALQHELSSARAVHDANLPEPRMTGQVRLNYLYEPMRQIGGDLLMIYPPDKHATPKYVILFDVTGHGVAAALSVNRIVGEIERLLAENPDESAATLTSALNRYIHLTLAKHHLYVSALILKIDLDANQIECVNAGHPTAYHINCPARTTGPVESTAMLLGVVGADSFIAETSLIPFGSGDAVVGYTDGASEATDPDGRMLGLAGVRDAICQTLERSPNPADWPVIVSRLVVEHRLAPSQDDTIIFSLWRA